MLNELRVSYSQFQNDLVGHFANRRDVVSKLGVVGLRSFDPSVWGIPTIALRDGLFSFGGGFSDPGSIATTSFRYGTTSRSSSSATPGRRRLIRAGTIGANTGDRFPANHYDLSSEKGLSQFHIGRRFTASLLYDLPFGEGKRFLNGGGLASKVLGDWRMGSILTFAEGGRSSVGNIGDRNNTGAPNHPDAVGISPNRDNPTPDRLWNLEAFDTSNPELRVREGNVGRSVLRLPGLANWDFSLLKDLTLREGQRLQSRFEAFNFANHPNWIAPFTDVRSPVFGMVPAAREMREIQFGIKYIF